MKVASRVDDDCLAPVMVSVRHRVTTISTLSCLSAGFFRSDGVACPLALRCGPRIAARAPHRGGPGTRLNLCGADLHVDVLIGEDIAVPAGVLRCAAFRGDHDVAIAGLPVVQREDELVSRLPAGRRFGAQIPIHYIGSALPPKTGAQDKRRAAAPCSSQEQALDPRFRGGNEYQCNLIGSRSRVKRHGGASAHCLDRVSRH
jgi:hypothetical protein